MSEETTAVETVRMSWIIRCLDMPAVMNPHRVQNDGKGCNKHFVIKTGKVRSQFVCKYCKKRTRIHLEGGGNAPVISGPYVGPDGKKQAESVANRLNDPASPENSQYEGWL